MTEVAGVLEHGRHSSPGRVRQHYKDVMVAEPELRLWIVADVMGGHKAGEIARAMVVNHIAARVHNCARYDSARLESAAVIYFIIQKIDSTGTWQITRQSANSGEQTINKHGVSKTMPYNQGS